MASQWISKAFLLLYWFYYTYGLFLTCLFRKIKKEGSQLQRTFLLALFRLIKFYSLGYALYKIGEYAMVYINLKRGKWRKHLVF